MDRTAWTELPLATRQAVEGRTGHVEQSETATNGVMSPLACTLRSASGPVFVKGTRLDDPSVWMYRAEAHISDHAPLSARPLWQVEAGGWLLFGYEFLVGRHPDLAPDSPDLPPLVDALNVMSAAPWPPQVRRKKPLHVRWAGFFPEGRAQDLDGNSLVHTDTSALNMLVTSNGIRLVDWALACPGPDWADTAFTLLRLIHAGHSPEQAEKFAQQMLCYRLARPEAVTTFAHAVRAVWESRERSDPAPHRAPLIAAARAWAEHRELIVS